MGLGVLAVGFGASGPAHATETDQYFAIDKRPRDSLSALNEKVNRELLGAVDLVNRRGDWDRASCEEVAHRVYQRFRISGLHKIELWAEHSPRVERVPSDEAHGRFKNKDSIYRNKRLWDWGLTFGVKATFSVAGVHLGADKLSHFFQTGWKYNKRYREYMEEGVPEREALERLVRYGVKTESGSLGLGTTGVFSFGDLEANYQGFLFYRSLCQAENPRLLKTAEGWRVTRPFDWREYVSPQLDETWNNSAFTPKRWREVRANLRKDYCSRLDSDAFVEHYRRYARYPGRPDDFNIRYVRELLARGELPPQEDYSVWAACERSRPDFGAGEAVTPEESPEPAPRYETPRFDGPIFQPTGELGGGGRHGAGSDWNTLLRVRFVLRETVVPEDAWDAVRTPEYLLWGSLDGTLVVGGPLREATLPYADLHLTPLERRFELNNASTGDTLAVGVAFVPVRLTRFLELNRRLGVEAAVAGVRGRLGTRLGGRQRVGVFAALALDALGYKAALPLSDVGTFQGLHVSRLSIEAGAELWLGEQLRLGLVSGGSVGIGLGWSRDGRGLSSLSDLGAYAEGQADVTRFFRLFARGQLDALQEPGTDRTRSAPTFLGGAAFRF
jgi:hypothetical protein